MSEYKVDRRPDAPFADQIGDLPDDASDARWEYRRVCAERASRGDDLRPGETEVYDHIINLMWTAMSEDEQIAELDAAPVYGTFDVSDVAEGTPPVLGAIAEPTPMPPADDDTAFDDDDGAR
jgi:hypothetical protein